MSSELVNYSTGTTVTANWLNRAQLREEGLATYVIYPAGGTFYAKALVPAGVDYSNSDAATVVQSAVNALTNGGRIILKQATYPFLSTVTYSGHAPLTIEGEACHRDRFYLSGGGTVAKGTIIVADTGIDAFNIGLSTGIDSRSAPIFTLRNVLIAGKDPATEPLGDSPTATGAGLKFSGNVNTGTVEDVQFHRKQYGIQFAPTSGTEINRIFLNRVAFSYNQYGMYHTANVLRYLALQQVEGYLNQFSLIKVNPTYDMTAYRVDDEGSSWNSSVGSHDCPIFITMGVSGDLHLHRISIIGGKGGVPSHSYALMEIQLSNYDYVDLSDIELVGTDQRCLYIDGSSANPYRCQIRGIYLGHDPGQATGFRGVVGDAPAVGLQASNIGHVSIHGGQIFATTKVQIPFAVGVIRLRDITNLSPVGNIASPYDNTNNWIGYFGNSGTLTSAKIYTCQGVSLDIYLAAGTVSAMTKNGQTVPYNSTLTTIHLEPGETWSITFSVIPTTALVMGG